MIQISTKIVFRVLRFNLVMGLILALPVLMGLLGISNIQGPATIEEITLGCLILTFSILFAMIGNCIYWSKIAGKTKLLTTFTNVLLLVLLLLVGGMIYYYRPGIYY